MGCFSSKKKAPDHQLPPDPPSVGMGSPSSKESMSVSAPPGSAAMWARVGEAADRAAAEMLACKGKPPPGTLDRILGETIFLHDDWAVPCRGLFQEDTYDDVCGFLKSGQVKSDPLGHLDTQQDKVQFFDALKALKGHDEVKERDGSQVRVLSDETFKNWGRTVNNTPAFTFFPKTKLGVCNIIRWAKLKGLKVRAAGYRHSWSDIFADDGQVIISLLSRRTVEDIPAVDPILTDCNELNGIEVVREVEENGAMKAWTKIGPATTNEQFRRWVTDNAFDEKTGTWRPWWTLPVNVIMVEVSLGGSMSTCSHGSGLKLPTIPDLVREVEFVNASGELQIVSDPCQVKALAGSFGMIGVVVSCTFALDVLTYAKMKPYKPRLPLAIPPPAGFDVPKNVDMTGISEEDRVEAFNRFVKHAEEDYYSEWFWFVFHDEAWVHCWNNDGLPSEAKDYPGEFHTRIQEFSAYMGELANSYVFTLLPGMLQAFLMSRLAMRVLPSDEVIVAPLIDALHFRRGVQNMRVLDMEWQIPIPGKADDPSKPDFTVCQRAWWDAVEIIYKRYNADNNDCPIRIALEARMVGSSDVPLSPFYGNKHGTFSIEVLTFLNVDPEAWLGVKQELTDKWTSYKDAEGKYLNARPHVAKEFQGLEVRGRPIIDHLREVAYSEQLSVFAEQMKKVAADGRFRLADAHELFSNDTLDALFGSVYKIPVSIDDDVHDHLDHEQVTFRCC